MMCRRATAVLLIVLAALSGERLATASAVPPPSEVPDGSEPGGLTATEDEVRAAKAGLGWFLLANVDRPTRVADPCPTLPVESVGWYLGELGLGMSERPYGTAVVWDTDVGGGLVSIRCGVDMSLPVEPEGTVAWSLDVTMLDGQATFAQFAVELAGRDVLIVQLPELRAQLALSCSDNGATCSVAIEIDDLVLTLRLKGLPGENREQIARDLVGRIVREVVANLGAVPPPQ